MKTWKKDGIEFKVSVPEKKVSLRITTRDGRVTISEFVNDETEIFKALLAAVSSAADQVEFAR